MTWRILLKASLGDLELEIDAATSAKTVAIVGPNGSGKSTILRMIVGALSAEAAEVSVADAWLMSNERRISVPMEARRLGYVPQGFSLFPHLNVLDNVAYGLREGRDGLGRRDAQKAAMAVLEELDSAGLAHRDTATLSGGEKQRAALARALAVSPRALLLDEPLSALDATARHEVRRSLSSHLSAKGLPTLIVTHDVRDAIALSAECWVLQKGRLVQRGTVAELRQSPASPFAEQFLAAGGLLAEDERQTSRGDGLG